MSKFSLTQGWALLVSHNCKF
uniref:Uncharacterized protein n=1 Tax=Nelumbo nucifera TaxID=4432 RepID=A0A822ZA29_NELNU|nr:TPA_asm: hypothetical protein HUJ06_016265 [Nelumbo nucifera]